VEDCLRRQASIYFMGRKCSQRSSWNSPVTPCTAVFNVGKARIAYRRAIEAAIAIALFDVGNHMALVATALNSYVGRSVLEC
jgi:hypothetical protein